MIKSRWIIKRIHYFPRSKIRKGGDTTMMATAGQNQMLLHWRSVPDGIEITQVETADRTVVLPETIQGRPVVSLGHHAFAPDRPPVNGELLHVTCGGGEVHSDTRSIEKVTLPATLRAVGDYAFYNCTGLRELHLTEPVERWGSSVLMNCRLLMTFFIHTVTNRAESASYFADELNAELDMTLIYPSGETARLIFPEYWESYEENTPAHHFEFHIYGAGYPYHHVFENRTISLKDYDALFSGMLSMEYDPQCAMRLAWYRLRFPCQLADAAAAQYLRYLQEHCSDVMMWLIEKRDSRGLAWFLPRSKADAKMLSAAADIARRLRLSEMLAILLERQHQDFPHGWNRTFDL